MSKFHISKSPVDSEHHLAQPSTTNLPTMWNGLNLVLDAILPARNATVARPFLPSTH